VNVIVIGAGIVGCAVAHELAARGAAVRVLEARGVGQGATRASAGILASTIEGHVPELLDLGARSLALYGDFIARVEKDSGSPVEYDRSGTLQIALNAAEAERLCALARSFHDTGIGHTLMEGAAARQFEPALPPDTVRALLVPQHGYVAVTRLTHALAQAAANIGAVMSQARVVEIEGGDTPSVRTADQVFEADRIIVCSGSWTDQLVSRAGTHATDERGSSRGASIVKPIRGQLLQLRLPRRPVSRVIWGERCYAVPWRDGTVLLGATVEDAGFDERPTVAGVADLLSEGQTLLPALRDAVFEEVRVGLRPMTRDELPAIGASTTMRHVVYATGHYRNGVLLAPLTAALVADLVLDGRQRPELISLSPARLGL
jgi:glycine oxidase